MKCPSCGYFDSKVIDSRQSVDGLSIRRRRECLECQKRFTTFETIEATQIIVIKKSGEKQVFDRNKLMSGVLKACQKRPVDAEQIVNEVEQELYNNMKTEVSTSEIGEIVMLKLKDLDQVAYVRFASVYRSFTDTTSFIKELEKMVKKDK